MQREEGRGHVQRSSLRVDRTRRISSIGRLRLPKRQPRIRKSDRNCAAVVLRSVRRGPTPAGVVSSRCVVGHVLTGLRGREVMVRHVENFDTSPANKGIVSRGVSRSRPSVSGSRGSGERERDKRSEGELKRRWGFRLQT
jgi:hypothetical protein